VVYRSKPTNQVTRPLPATAVSGPEPKAENGESILDALVDILSATAELHRVICILRRAPPQTAAMPTCGLPVSQTRALFQRTATTAMPRCLENLVMTVRSVPSMTARLQHRFGTPHAKRATLTTQPLFDTRMDLVGPSSQSALAATS
jgi:hypothetical protein